jgi:hypothetical protein
MAGETMDEALRGESVELDEDEGIEVEDTDDGGAVIRLSDEQDNSAKQEHFGNIIDEVDPARLKTAVSDLLEKITRDKQAREKRDKLYEEGLRRTGLGDDAPGGAQFTGANRVVHPMLVEACVDFGARVMKELFPANGPVKSKIMGRAEKAKVEKAQRKAEFMNWQATEQMAEFRSELEQLTTQLPLGGAQYLKLRWDARRRRPAAEFIPIDDIYLPFAATNFYTAERKTHVQYITEATYRARVKAGEYIDVDLPAPDDPEFSAASRANDKIEGRQDTSYNEDGLRTVFEVCVSLDVEEEGEFKPYILTVDKSSERGLSLYRNWDEADASCCELEWIIEFPFIPWRGAYPIGLTHMIGGLSGAATGALRALLDSAHIQNVPTLLKLKGGPGGQTLNVQPTEVVELEGGGLVDDVRKLAMPLPFQGPSPTLYQLLGFLVDAGKGVVQTSFEKLSDQNPNQPVGTTMALIEQGMVVFSSIHTRLHGSMSRVFKVLHRINSAYLTEEDIQAQAGELEIEPGDFDGPLDVIPVSDPAIFSETQRFAQVQAIMQRAALMPQMYDARRVEEMFLRSMKVPDDLLLPKPGEDDLDPVSENVAAAMGRPVYVLPKQDHLAHLKIHMAFLQSPLFGQNPAIMKSYLYPMAQHLRDHLLSYYLTQSHETVHEAAAKKLIGDDSAEEARVIANVQRAIEQELGGFAQMLAQIDQMAQQFAPQPPMPPDNSIQVAQLNAQVKHQSDAQRAQTEQAKLADRQQDRQARLTEEQLRQQGEDRRQAEELGVRYQMNTDDNETAMKLAAAEIATGEHFAVSTGTGVNPGV